MCIYLCRWSIVAQFYGVKGTDYPSIYIIHLASLLYLYIWNDDDYRRVSLLHEYNACILLFFFFFFFFTWGMKREHDEKKGETKRNTRRSRCQIEIGFEVINARS